MCSIMTNEMLSFLLNSSYTFTFYKHFEVMPKNIKLQNMLTGGTDIRYQGYKIN
jgi:hypothetical protein